MGKLVGMCVAVMLVSMIEPCTSLRNHQPRQYVIDLDLPPVDRWNQVAKDFPTFPDQYKTFITHFIPTELYPVLLKIAERAIDFIEEPYAGEMVGLARAVNVSVAPVVIANLILDFSTFCTNIVCQDSNNKIWHARNFDYSQRELMAELMIEGVFVRGGKVQYTTVGPVGFVGVITGQKPNVFSVAVDTRFKGSILTIAENVMIALMDKKAMPITMLIRKALEQSSRFEEAVQLLSTTDTTGPVYFILAGVGPGEGAVVTKDRLKSDDIWRMNSTSEKWYLVETNYDHWTKKSDPRREAARKGLVSLGRTNITVDSLKNILTTPPVFQRHPLASTIVSTIMSAGDPELMTSWIWD